MTKSRKKKPANNSSLEGSATLITDVADGKNPTNDPEGIYVSTIFCPSLTHKDLAKITTVLSPKRNVPQNSQITPSTGGTATTAVMFPAKLYFSGKKEAAFKACEDFPAAASTANDEDAAYYQENDDTFTAASIGGTTSDNELTELIHDLFHEHEEAKARIHYNKFDDFDINKEFLFVKESKILSQNGFSRSIDHMYLFPLSSNQQRRENEDFSAAASSLERNETQNPQVTPSTGGTATTAAFHEGAGTKNPTTNPSTGGTKAHTTDVFPTQNHRRNNFITNSVMNLSGDIEKERE